MNKNGWVVSRRKAIGLLGGITATVFAGCKGDEEPGNELIEPQKVMSVEDGASRLVSNRDVRSSAATLGVVFRRYPREDELEHCLDSFLGLAKKLKLLGHTVDLITEVQSKQEVHQLDAELSERATFIDFGFPNATSRVLAGIEEWYKREFTPQKAKAQYGIICLLGHGETRKVGDNLTGHFLLTPTADGEAGVIDIRELEHEIGRLQLPIILIVDTCRPYSDTPVPDQRVPASSDKELAGLTTTENQHSRGGFRSSTSSQTVTKIFACHPYELATDMIGCDLTSMLTSGLKFDQHRQTFHAREIHERLMQNEAEQKNLLEGPHELSFYSWYLFTAFKSFVLHEGAQVPQLEHGYLDPKKLIIASAVQAFPNELPPLNLIHAWQQFDPNMALKAKVTDSAVHFSRPVEGDSGKHYNVAFFSQAFPWKRQKLLIDFYARYQHARSGDKLRFLIMAGDNRTQGQYVSWRQPREIPYEELITIEIPLENAGLSSDEELEFTSLGFSLDPGDISTWPVGASLTVSRITLIDCDSEKAYPARTEAKGNLNLISSVRWADAKQSIKSVPRIDSSSLNGQRKLVWDVPNAIEEHEVDCVAEIILTKHVWNWGSKLSVDAIGDTISSNCKLTIEVLQDGKSLISANLSGNELQSREMRQFPIEVTGSTTHVRFKCHGLRRVEFFELNILD